MRGFFIRLNPANDSLHWLGHVSLDTTNVYAKVDLEMKAKALANCEVGGEHPQKPWREQEDVMAFLRSL
jgi:integrase/recombinase XerD